MHRKSRGALALAAAVAGIAIAALGAALLALVLSVLTEGNSCAPAPGGSIALGPPGAGQLVGATEYGGPGDPSSGVIGASGANLLSVPDSYAQLGGTTFQTATALGGLPYMTPLRITWGGHAAIAYKRDFGLGGGPVDGLPRVIDLWWELGRALRIPYENGLWSGAVRIERPPANGAGAVLNQSAAGALATGPGGEAAAGTSGPGCSGSAAGVPLAPGQRARLLSDGLAAAPVGAPLAVKGIIAAGNQIVGKPYMVGGGHGIPLSQIAPSYDCSGSVEHLLYGGGL